MMKKCIFIHIGIILYLQRNVREERIDKLQEQSLRQDGMGSREEKND